MSEENVELKKSEETITNVSGKKKKKIITIIIALIVLLIVSISLICVLKYKAEHKYIPFAELDEEQIVFVREYRTDTMHGLAGYIYLYGIDGREYKVGFRVEEYGQIKEIYSAFINGEEIESDNIQVEVQENHSEQRKIVEMYEKLLLVDDDEYKKVSNTIIYDGGVVKFYGVRYLENGEVECVLLWTDSEYEGKIILDDPYAKEIREWLRTL